MIKKYSGLLALFLFPSVLFLGVVYSTDLYSKTNHKIEESPVVFDELSDYEKNNISVFREAAPKVVYVHNLKSVRRFYSFNTTEYQQGTGSGFIWDNQGHIVTNYHVIYGADNVAVTLMDGKKYEARVIGVEPRKDIAVLKINLNQKFDHTFHERLKDSSTILVGQKAIAIGNPFGLDHTFTVGTVSALGRSMQSIGNVTIRDMIQTDAAINPGNSGGPLLDNKGYLLGMNTAIFSPTGGSSGIGFAVPANTINRIVYQIIRYGKVIQPGIGVQALDDSIARRLRIQGAIISRVLPGSPASKIGLKETYQTRRGEIVIGDVVVGIDDIPVRSYDDLYNALEDKKVGDTVKLIYFRNNQKREAQVQLIEL